MKTAKVHFISHIYAPLYDISMFCEHQDEYLDILNQNNFAYFGVK